ncbi:MAG TPA: VWA domain-containing protein [Vicinamibacterales bacterium]|nr:VWA domain-containing protein [Vicinamibacterales bacterium]
MTIPVLAVAIAAAGALVSAQQQPQQPPQGDNPQAFRFRTGVELVNVTATVTDRSGRFVDGLRQEDFRVYDNDRQQAITHFSNERVPVSLGIVLDTSGSMDGEKMRAARRALDRFLFDLLDPADEVFLYRFDTEPELVEGWTSDKRKISDALSGIRPRGGTALYDSVAAAIPLAQNGRHRKKALVIISDGNDTSSNTDVRALQQLIRQTEVLVYAIGIDGRAEGSYMRQAFPQPPPRRPRPPIPLPFPMPGGRPPSPLPPQPRGPVGGGRWQPGPEDRVNVAALRDITDDSGGRTEIIRDAHDLDPATAGIADELSRQYYIGYPAPGEHDGQWHTIRVDVRGSYHVRARRGYVASR